MPETPTRLQNLLATACSRHPQRIAIRSSGHQITFGQLQLQVDRLSAGLLDLGVQPGARVAWLLPNSIEAVTTTLACYQVGAVSVPLNYRFVAEEAMDVIDRTGAEILIFHRDREPMIANLMSDARPQLRCVSVGPSALPVEEFSSLFRTVESSKPSVVTVPEDSPALILFTSGSTGRPKGVVHSHEGSFCAIDVSRRVFGFNETDVVLVGKPISHAGGLQTQLLPALLAGAEVILEDRPKPDRAVDLIRQFCVTQCALLASDLLDFVEYLELRSAELPSLNNLIGSGDSVPIDLHQRFLDLFGWQVMEGAGMTEVGGYYAVNPRDGIRKWGSLGLPTPGTKLRVVDDHGHDCPPETHGEIILQSESTTTGYWENDLATTELYLDGWLHTGDLGYLDSDGYVWFVGRKKLIIVCRGSNIAPAEVENALDEHPRVRASVVVGVKDDRDGQAPVACVALLPGTPLSIEADLREYVHQRLAEYKNPANYMFLDELPRTRTGKFDRSKLKELAEEQFGATRTPLTVETISDQVHGCRALVKPTERTMNACRGERSVTRCKPKSLNRSSSYVSHLRS